MFIFIKLFLCWSCYFLQCNMFLMYIRDLKTVFLRFFKERLMQASEFALLPPSPFLLLVSLLRLQENSVLNKTKFRSAIYKFGFDSYILDSDRKCS